MSRSSIMRQDCPGETLRAVCDYYWPYLETIWNPPSKLHWFKAIQAVKEYTELDYPMPANLVLSAARFGQAGLRNRISLQEVVMNHFFAPVSPSDWNKLWNGTEKQIRETLEQMEAGWRPKRYEKMRTEMPAYRKPENQEARWRGNHLTSEWRRDQDKTFNYLEQIFRTFETRVRNDALKKGNPGRHIDAKTSQHIGFRLVSRTEIPDENPTCPICLETLVDVGDLCRSIATAAGKQNALLEEEGFMDELRQFGAPRLEIMVLKCFYHDWKDLLEINDVVENRVGLDMTIFVYNADYAYYRLRHLRESRCVQAAELVCGPHLWFAVHSALDGTE